MRDLRSGVGRRWSAPVGALLLAAASLLVYDRAPPAVAEVAIVPYALALTLAPSFIYPWLRRHGVGTCAATGGALCVFAAWLVKEGHRVQKLYGLAGAVFYAFNPLAVGIALLLVFQIAVAELLLRRRRCGRFELASGPGLALAIVLVIGGSMGALAATGDGSELFYHYVHLYARLLGE
jgi:hypothetical protein